jgi:hypothetical protein
MHYVIRITKLLEMTLTFVPKGPTGKLISRIPLPYKNQPNQNQNPLSNHKKPLSNHSVTEVKIVLNKKTIANNNKVFHLALFPPIN